MSESRRSQIVTDQPVQGELLFRAIVYWFLCMFVLYTLIFAWTLFTGPPQPLLSVFSESLAISAPAIFGAVFLLPLVLYDLLKVSNRFVGPIQRVKTALKQLADGEPARRVYLRRDDFWQELAHYTNVIADRVESKAAQTSNEVSDDETAYTLELFKDDDLEEATKELAAFTSCETLEETVEA